LSPGCAPEETLDDLAEATLPKVPEFTDSALAETSPQKSKTDVPRVFPAPIVNRPRREIKKPARFVNHVETDCSGRATTSTLSNAGFWTDKEPPPLPRRNQETCGEIPSHQRLSDTDGWMNGEPLSSHLWSQKSAEESCQDSGCWMSVEWGHFGPLDGQLIGTLVMSC